MAWEDINTGQVAIVATATWQKLPTSNPLTKGVTLVAASKNTAEIVAAVTNSGDATTDGTGSGVIVQGNGTFIQVQNTDALYVAGTEADVVSWVAW